MAEIPRSEQFNDIYFAVEDGLAESRYVFLEHNYLPQGWADKDRFVIAETGFGTGLNFLCAWTEFEKTVRPHQKLHYYSFEKFPLSAADIKTYLAHWAHEFGGRLEILCEKYPMRVGGWHTIHVSEQVTLTVIFDDVNRAIPELDTPVDCWFLDGHAPAKNPDMWSDVVFENIGRLSVKGTRFATFTAAGFVRRGLQAVGFDVSKVRGFGAKQDMTVGVFDIEKPVPSVPRVYKKIAVIGGGIAGCSAAAALNKAGCDVTLFEKDDVASGASGNLYGLCNPRITIFREIESDFYAPAFSLANRLYRDIAVQADIGYTPCGSLHLATDERKDKRYRAFAENWAWHSDHAQFLEPAEAAQVAGVDIPLPALFLPDAAMVSPFLLVRHLAQSLRVVTKHITEIIQRDGGWFVDGDMFDAVVVAGAAESQNFPQLADINLQKVRGQVTIVKPTSAYEKLKTSLCYSGYASPAVDGQAVIGSTFQYWVDDDAENPDDDVENIEALRGVLPHLADGLDVIGSRAAFRCASKDRLPIVGSVDGYDGLYLTIAHGSHGLLSAVMAAEMLVADMRGLSQILPRSVRKLLSARRVKSV